MTGHDARDHAADPKLASHGDHGDAMASHGTLRGYATGFLLSVVLTAIPFWMVMGNAFASSTVTAFVIMGIGAVQIVVHMVYFLHMNTKSEGGWSMLALIFTLVLLVIMLVGSIWVMHHLNVNMMPMSPGDMSSMP